ncbi:hypothetical protein [Sphingomonas sp. HMP6]|uniref:hypothetical protein n=1 Tax=Sphingomonas sp. HMP6 TaxID=1517551 RepID=UPI00159A05EB|nr:hypothetical protein [Sphingomonas sp. HMP6]BCA58885.1 hypothetical protein HMP06_1654 [Sphingomonas sp. HMP6]
MHFTPEQRGAWTEQTRDSPFNRWLRDEVNNRDGTLDLAKLHALAARFEIDAGRYAHLNPGQQRMNIGNRLRRIVRPHHFQGLGPQMSTVAEPRGSEPVTPQPQQSILDEDLHPDRSIVELLQLHASAIESLRLRGIVRTANAPIGDYAEHLFAQAFGWELEVNSAAGHDAVDPTTGTKYQIKARRLRLGLPSERQLSQIRALPELKFDQLAVVLFNTDFGIRRAALVPHATVSALAIYVAHVNAWRLIMDDAIWSINGVMDVTDQLRAAQAFMA